MQLFQLHCVLVYRPFKGWKITFINLFVQYFDPSLWYPVKSVKYYFYWFLAKLFQLKLFIIFAVKFLACFMLVEKEIRKVKTSLMHPKLAIFAYYIISGSCAFLNYSVAFQFGLEFWKLIPPKSRKNNIWTWYWYKCFAAGSRFESIFSIFSFFIFVLQKFGQVLCTNIRSAKRGLF